MSTLFRTFRPHDLTALRALHEQDGPSPTMDRAATQEADADHAGESLHRFVAEEDGRVLGYSYLARSAWHPEGWVQCEVFVQPHARRRGLGSELLRLAVAHAQEGGAVSMTTWASGTRPEAERFARAHGFEEVQRFVTMTLTVAEADPAPLEALVAGARARGISLLTFADTGGTPGARRKLHELNRRLAPLLPGNGDEFPSFEEYEREIIEADWFRAEGQLIAADGERWVGLVGLGFYEEGRQLRHEFTAVDPAYRGRGVALALKAWSVQKAAAWGAHEIRTGNDASNAAIIGVNRRLGYRLTPGVVKLRRTLEPRGPGPR